MYVENALEIYSYLFKEFEKRGLGFVELKDDVDTKESFGYDIPPSKE